MAKIRCKEDYSSAGAVWAVGEVVSSEDAEYIAWLMRQCPSAWESIPEEGEAKAEGSEISKPGPVARLRKVIK